LLDAAGIQPERRLGFHGLRKALATHLAAVNPMVATMQLGHTGEMTTREHYVHPDAVASTMANVPQPSFHG